MTTARLGVVGIALIGALLLAALAVPQGWYLVRTGAYSAEFANAGGLTAADPVYVAGVPAGRVDSVELAAGRVEVHFRLDDRQSLGDRTRAAVKLRTVLGKRYLEITPAGSGPVGPDRSSGAPAQSRRALRFGDHFWLRGCF